MFVSSFVSGSLCFYIWFPDLSGPGGFFLTGILCGLWWVHSLVCPTTVLFLFYLSTYILLLLKSKNNQIPTIIPGERLSMVPYITLTPDQSSPFSCGSHSHTNIQTTVHSTTGGLWTLTFIFLLIGPKHFSRIYNN